jgi:hypothetical protein
VAALGLMANVGIKGSSAGTALNNMLTKLSTASPKTTAKFKEMGVEVKDAQGNFVGMNKFLASLNKSLPGIGGNMDQVKFLAESMGLRGQRAASNLADSITKMGKDGKGSVNAFKELSAALGNTGNIVDEMSADKLKSMEGSFKILGSSIEGVLIEGFMPLVKVIGPLVKEFADFVGSIAKAMDLLNLLAGGSKTAGGELAKMNPTVVALAQGFKEGFDAVKDGINSVVGFLKRMGNKLAETFGAGGVTKLVKFATIFVAIAGAIAPVAAALVGVGFIISSVIIPAVSGIATIIGAVLSPWGLAIAGVVGLLFVFKDEIFAFASAAKTRLMTFMDPVVSKLSAIWENLKAIWTSFTSAFKSGVNDTGASASSLGDTVANNFGNVILKVVSVVSAMIAGFKAQWVSMSPLFAKVGGSIKKVIDAFVDMGTILGESLGMTSAAGDGWSILGEVVAATVGIIAAAIGVFAEILAAAIGIVTTVVDVIVSVLGSAINIIINIVNIIADVLAGNWGAAWQSAKNIVFEVVKAIIKVVTGMVKIIAGAIDAIAGIMGKDLGAKKFIDGVEKDILKDTAKFFDQAKTQAAKAPKVAPAKPVVIPKVAPAAPGAVAAPQATQAFAGLAKQGATASEIAAAVSKVKVGASIKLSSKVVVNETTLGEVVEKIQKDLEAKKGDT